MNRKYLSLVLLLLLSGNISIVAQDKPPIDVESKMTEDSKEINDTSRFKLTSSLVANFNRTDLFNWATGGVPQTTFNVVWLTEAARKWEHWKVKASLRTSYGFVKPQGDRASKTDDYLAFSMLAGRKLSDFITLTALADLKTQLTLTTDDTNAVVSALFSPAWIIGAIGLSANRKYWEAFLSPLTMKATFINNRLPMTQRYGVPSGTSVRYEPGAYGIIKANWSYKAFVVASRLEIFYNYIQPTFPDINWETLFTLKVTKWFGVSYFIHSIYDVDVPGPDETRTGFNRYLQIKTVLGLSVSFTY